MAQPVIVNNFRATLAAALSAGATQATLSAGSVAKLKAAAPTLKNGDFIPICVTQGADPETAWASVNIIGYAGGEVVNIQPQAVGAQQAWAIGDKFECRNSRELSLLTQAPLNNPQRPFLFIGDSRTRFGQPWRRPGDATTGAFDGRTVYVTSGSFSASTQWIAEAVIDGTAGLNTQGVISSDANGLLSYAHAGDTAGAKVDVTNGGWFYLQSGTNGVGITIGVRGNTAKVLNAGGTYATSGYPLSWDYDPKGHVTWIAGQLGDTFSDYRAYAMQGASTQDIIKQLPQMFAAPVEAALLELGVNNIPDSGSTLAQCQALIADWKTIIDYACQRVRKLYVIDIFPAAVKDTAAQKWIAKANSAIRAYCRTTRNARFIQTQHQVAKFSNTVATSIAGCFKDELHLLPFGGYRVSVPIVTAIRRDYPHETQYRDNLDVWDSTLQVGAWNLNPTFTGSGGTGSGSNGVTGSVPTSWSAVRGGTTQLCALSTEVATDGGPDWLVMTLTGDPAAVAATDFHTLQASVNPFPSGVAVGEYFRIVAEVRIGAMTGGGLAALNLYANNNTNTNQISLLQVLAGWPIASFTTENPVLQLPSEPQKLLDITSPLTLRFRAGAAASATAVISIRNYRIEKCDGPIY